MIPCQFLRPALLPALAFTLVLLPGPSRAADDDLTVLKAEPNGVSPRKMLHDYLIGQCKVQFDARRQAVAAMHTPADVKRRQDELKAKFIEALGGFPEKTPLNGKVVGSDQRDGYRMERVIYESRPNHHVTANLYLPEGKGPFPGVIVPCGHSTNGKGSEAYQRVSILLAKNGIAALIYDPIGQGERYQLPLESGKPVTGSTNEHTLVGVGALLVGQSTATYRIWDGMRSLDYLASRPEIDPKRLGCTGNSGGGTLTSYLMALDDRVMAAAPSCFITSVERLFATIGPQDAEQNITGQVAIGLEHADFITLRAPKPTLLLVATQDFFDIQGSWITFREAKQIYGVLGFTERVDLAEFNVKHSYNKGQREAMVRFMRRWLLGKDDVVVEDNFTTVKDKDLQCTRTGQVLEDFKGKSAFALNVERENQLAEQRAKFQVGNKPEDVKKEIRRLLALPATIKPAVNKGQPVEIKRDGYVIQKISMETEAGIQVPGLLFTSQADAPMPLILYVNDQGKSADAAPGGPIEKLVKAGNRVFAVDLRGLGETSPGTLNPAKPGYFGVTFNETYLSLHLNRPLLGQKVYDLLAIVEKLTQEPNAKTISSLELVGIGSAGPVVLHAAALDSRIKKVTVQQSVVSWSAVVKTPLNYNQLNNVVTGALKTYDLPDLAALIAPRPLTIRGAVDPALKPVSKAALEDAYARCKEAYAKQKAEKQLMLQAE
jgi:cephalosporin-C deacetylase-like acetyl esterase